MKIVGTILAVIMLTGSAFVGVVSANKSLHLARDLNEIDLEKSQREELGLPTSSRMKLGGVIGFMAALGAAVLLVVTFATKKLIPVVVGAAMLLAILSIVGYPAIETGPTDGAAPRTLAIVAAVFALIGAGGSLLVKKSVSVA